MDMKQMYKAMVNSPVTYLARDISATDREVEVVAGAALPDAPNMATLGFGQDAETIYYEEKNGNVLSGIIRGYQGAAKAWSKNTTAVARLLTAYDVDTANENIETLYQGVTAHTHTGLDGTGKVSYNDLADVPEIDITGQLRHVLKESVNSVPEIPLNITIGQKSDFPAEDGDASLMSLVKQLNVKIDDANRNKSQLPSYFDVQSGIETSWKDLFSFQSINLANATSVLHENRLYVFGPNVSPYTQAYSYDLETRMWKGLASSETATRSSLGAVVYQNKAYIFSAGLLQIYDIETDTWKTGAAPTTNLAGCIPILYGGDVYLIRGNVNLVYHIDSGEWETLAAYSLDCNGCARVLYQNKIYCFGSGTSTYRQTQIYDIEENKWTAGASSAVDNRNTVNSAVVYNDKIYIFGSNASPNNQTQIYDIASNTWSSGAVVPNGSASSNAVFYDNKAYVFFQNNYTRIYDFESNTWATGVNAPISMENHRILEAGGVVYALHNAHIRKYSIEANTWSTEAVINTSFNVNTYAASRHSKTYIFGTMPQTYVYDWENHTLAGRASPPITAYSFAIEYKNRIYVGGANAVHFYAYDIEADKWTACANAPVNFTKSPAVLYEGKIYVFGLNTSAITHIYDIESNTWANGANSSYALESSKAVLYGHYVHVFRTNNGAKLQAQVYNILTNTWAIRNDAPIDFVNWPMAVYGSTVYFMLGGRYIAYNLEKALWYEEVFLDKNGLSASGNVIANQDNNRYLVLTATGIKEFDISSGFSMGILKQGDTIYADNALLDQTNKRLIAARTKFKADRDIAVETASPRVIGWMQSI